MPSIAEISSELYDVDDSLAAANVAQQAWRHAVDEVTDKAMAALPHSASRIEKAVQIVLAGDVELLENGTASVRSQSNGVSTYLIVNGHCECLDFERAPGGQCKHKISVGLHKRALALLHALQTPHEEPVAQEPETHQAGIAPEHLVTIQGKRFILYAGLLALAHARGLTALTATWTFNDAGLSLAQAVAVFPFGTFTECGDASPDNVNKKIAPHFRRVALTRAKARVLRDALNVDMVSLEELSE
jgi:hypothetical protein